MFLQVAAKFLQIAGIVLLLGPPVFWLFFWRPEPDRSTGLSNPVATLAAGWVRKAAFAGAVLLVFSSIGQIARILAPLVSGLPLDLQLQFGWSFLLSSFGGRMQLLRLVLVAGFLVLLPGVIRISGTPETPATAWRARLGPLGGTVLPVILLAFAVAVTVTVVLGGHAVSSLAKGVAVLAQWAHLIAVTAWAGGVLTFTALPWRELERGSSRYIESLTGGLRSLSSLGLAAVMTISVSGFVLGGLYVFSMTAATESLYGRGLALKVVLLLLIAGIAGINRLWLLPKLERAKDGLSGALKATSNVMRIEAAAIVIVLGLSAFVSQTPPPSTPGSMSNQVLAATSGSFDVEVGLSSDAGDAVQFEIVVIDKETGRPAELDELGLELDMPGHFMGIAPMVAEPTSPGTFKARSALAMAGRWEAAMLLRRGGETEVAIVGFQIAPAALDRHSRLQQILAGPAGGAVMLVLSLAVTAAGVAIFVSDSGAAASAAASAAARGGGGRQRWMLGMLLVAAGSFWTAQLSGLTLPGSPTLRLENATPESGQAPSAEKSGGRPSAATLGGKQPMELVATVGEYLLKAVFEPAQPGPNTVRLHLQDYVGDAVPGAEVNLMLSHPEKPTLEAFHTTTYPQPDGTTFTAEVDLAAEGVWEMVVEIVPEHGPTEETTMWVPVPMRGARELLLLADEAMNRLQSVRMQEEMRGRPGGTLTTDVAFVAPDRMRLQADDGREMVAIGETRYLRTNPDQPWIVGSWPREGGYRWPEFDHAGMSARETIVRRDVIDGRPMLVVAFVQDPPGIHYNLWIDAMDHLIYRLEMLTAGHYMYWEFYDFNEPIVLEPPDDAD